MIQNKEVLEQIREEAVKELNSYDCRILVCSGTGCVATGSQKIYEKFMEIAKCLISFRSNPRANNCAS